MTQTRKGGNVPTRLKFNEKLVGKGLSTDALVKKLKALHEELAGLDQDHVDTKSLMSVHKDLIGAPILLHKDKGVKAYAACCLSDLLRLFAPDAPYTSNQIQDIFEFFVKQLLIGLKGVDAMYYTQYYHLLESLSTVKSVVLICDLPAADKLISLVFHDFFEIVKRSLPKQAEMFMADILGALIEEAQTIPDEVMETLMGAFKGKASVRIHKHLSRVWTNILTRFSQSKALHIDSQ